MGKIKIEAFLSIPATAGDERLRHLLKGLEEKFGEKTKITISSRDDGLFKEYNLTGTPAVVIGEMIKIMGFCPSEESILTALKDLGV